MFLVDSRLAEFSLWNHGFCRLDDGFPDLRSIENIHYNRNPKERYLQNSLNALITYKFLIG